MTMDQIMEHKIMHDKIMSPAEMKQAANARILYASALQLAVESNIPPEIAATALVDFALDLIAHTHGGDPSAVPAALEKLAESIRLRDAVPSGRA
jgi:hypothetical protein